MRSVTDFLNQQKQAVGSRLRLSVILGSVAGLLLIAQAWCLAVVVNAVIFAEQTLVDVLPWLLAMLALMLSRAGLAYVSEQVAFSAAAVVKQALREQLFQKLQRLGPLYLSGERSGEISTTLTDGVEALESYFARYLPAMALAGWVPLAILVFVLPLDWKSALVMIVTAPLIPFFMVMIGKGAERLNQQQWKQLSRMGGHFLDVIQGLSTLKLFNASQREAEVIARISDDYRHATMRVLRVAFLSSLALEFFATVSIAIVAVLIGFRLLFGEMDFFAGFFVLLLAPEFYLPLRSLGTHYHARMDAIAAAERMVEILDSEETTSQVKAHHIPPRATPTIRFQQVYFNYGEREALKGVDFTIPANQRVAVVGPSGSGKTTLVNLLLGFIEPDRGKLLINDCPLSELGLLGWRRHIAWVPQRPRLFHGTVRENLCLGLSGIEDSQIMQALSQMQALDFVEALPKGLDTLVGEGGQGLSGGQVQRLALARAFLRDAGLVILDEPTAHLDSEHSALIRQAIGVLSEDRTLLTIAHRLETIKEADRIVVLEQGQVVQQGKHEALLQAGGLYQQLVAAQADAT